MLRMTLIAVCTALAACSPKAAAPKADEKAAETAQPTASGPVTDKAEASAETAWIELLGRWAPPGACDDDMQAWVIDAKSFNLYEMHCEVRSMELLADGVKAVGDCTVEGFNDGTPDAYDFKRGRDANLTIVAEGNGAATTGLVLCAEDGTR